MNFPDCREGAAYDHSFDSPFATLGEVRGRKKVRTAPKATSRGPAKKEDANIASPPKTWERRHPCLLALPERCRQGCLRSQVSLPGLAPRDYSGILTCLKRSSITATSPVCSAPLCAELEAATKTAPSPFFSLPLATSIPRHLSFWPP